MDAKLAAALTAGRDAIQRMQRADSDDAYFNAAAQLGDAFTTIDRILTSKEEPRRG